MRIDRTPSITIIKHVKYFVGLLITLLVGWILYPHKTESEVEILPASTSTAVVVTIPESIPDKIKFFSEKYEIEYELAYKVAKAESRFKNVGNYKYTGESGKYTAYGIYQITRTTYKAFCGDPSERLDVDKNIECAMKIMSTSGLHHWDESKQNWSK